MADAKLTGDLAKIRANLARLHPSVGEALEVQLKIEAEDFADAARRAMAASYADSGDHQHETLVGSVHAYKNPHRVISYVVIADARDAEGKFIGSNVEAGHLARDGSHVAAVPAFAPTWRARRKAARRRLSAAARKAVRALFPEV